VNSFTGVIRSTLGPLRLPGFPHLAGSYLVNELGNWLGEIALAILIFEATGSEVATAALFLAMQFVPALTTPPLVARLEAWPARRVLPALYTAEAASFALLAFLASDERFALAPVLILASLDGMLAVTARTITRASAAAVLAPAGQLREGNGLLNVGFTVGAAAGPALAGLVVAGAGVEVALLGDAASFLAVAILLAFARLPSAEISEGGWIPRLRSGFAYVRDRPALRDLLAAQGAAFIFFALVIPIEVAFAKETLDAGDFGYGLLLAAWGTGMVSGSFVFASLGRIPLTALIAFSTLTIGLAYLAISVSPTLAVACVASAAGGLGNGVQWVAIVTEVQELTHRAYQARVVSLLESIGSAMPGLGFVAGGVIAAVLSPRASYAVAGAGVLVVLAIAVIVLRKVRWERPEGPEEDALRRSDVISPA
jgi:MFS family permease